MLDWYRTGPGIVIFRGIHSELGVILTGLLQALGGLSEMVMIAILLVEVSQVSGVIGLKVLAGVFWKSIS